MNMLRTPSPFIARSTCHVPALHLLKVINLGLKSYRRFNLRINNTVWVEIQQWDQSSQSKITYEERKNNGQVTGSSDILYSMDARSDEVSSYRDSC